MPEQTEYWGIVNGKTYANGDIAEAVRLAQENGKKTVSIPAGTYSFNASKVFERLLISHPLVPRTDRVASTSKIVVGQWLSV